MSSDIVSESVFLEYLLIKDCLEVVKKDSLLKASSASLELQGPKTSAFSISSWINFAEYPLTPAKMGFPVAPYSKILEGSTF